MIELTTKRLLVHFRTRDWVAAAALTRAALVLADCGSLIRTALAATKQKRRAVT